MDSSSCARCGGSPKTAAFDHFRRGYEWLLAKIVRFRWVLVAAYLAVSLAIIGLVGSRLGTEIFPTIDTGQFRLRMRAPDGTDIDRTEQVVLKALKVIQETAGADNVQMTLGYLGTIPSTYPINAVYQWMRGPEDAVMWVALKRESGIHIEPFKEELRGKLAQALPDVQFSFEPADIINEVMSFGSSTPVEVAVSGPDFGQTRPYAAKVKAEMGKISGLRDLQIVQSLDYPTVQVDVDRKKAGTVYVTPIDVSRSLAEATSSSRFTVPNFWADPKTGIGYQVQVEVPAPGRPLAAGDQAAGLDRRFADGSGQTQRRRPSPGSGRGHGFHRNHARRNRPLQHAAPGEHDGERRRHGPRQRLAGSRCGPEARGRAPPGAKVEVRGQIPPMRDMLGGLALGLGLAVVVIFLLLSANFQSLRLSLVTVSTAPAVIAGVVVMLYLTRTTLNIQSFIGAIMAVGVAMANAILLVTFAEEPATLRARPPPVRRSRRREPAPRHPDDHLRHDGGHAAHGAGLGRVRSAERALGPGSHRRPGGGHRRHAVRAPLGFRPGAVACDHPVGFARSRRPRERLPHSFRHSRSPVR